MSRSLLILSNFFPSAMGWYYERAFRTDPELRDDVKIVTAGPANRFGYPVDIAVENGHSIDEVIEQLPADFSPDTILYFDSAPFFYTDIPACGLPSVFLCSDWKKYFTWHSEMANIFDLSIVAWAEAESAFRAMGAQRVKTWYWGGFDPEFFKPVTHEHDKTNDVVFLGTLDPVLCRYRGKTLERLLALRDEGLRISVESGKWLTEAAKLYHSSTLAFNKGWDNGYNCRVLEGMASGTMMITQKVSNEQNSLGIVPGEHIVCYDSDDDLITKIRYYLDHSDEREAIAEQGMRFVHERYSYAHQARRLLELLDEEMPRVSAMREEDSLSRLDHAEAVSLMFCGKPEAALTLFEQLDRSESPDLQNAFAVCAAYAQDSVRAEKEFLELLSRFGEYTLGQVNYGLFLNNIDRADLAEGIIKRTVGELSHRKLTLSQLRGLTFLLQRSRFWWDHEAAYYDHLLESESTCAESLQDNFAFHLCHQLAAISTSRDETDAAIEFLNQAHKSKPDDGYTLSALAALHEGKGQFKEAAALLEQAIRFEPFFSQAQARLVRLYIDRLSEQEKGMNLLLWALCSNPFYEDNFPADLYLAAALCYTRKEYTKAVNYWRRYMRRLPENDELVVMLYDALQKSGGHITEALREREKSADHFNRMDILGGLRLLKHALELDPEEPETYFLTGKILNQLGKDVEAYRYFSQAVSLSPFNEQYAQELRETASLQDHEKDAVEFINRLRQRYTQKT